ncbi:PRTRC system protein F [Burkholderia plantarii]|uniref:PRTRC system protein F n=1 Tax=Burkholderia plantarii TaxID=41899 RepID=UPI00272CD053|nr:PRTRC system protein F [Burkholderia plantarii]WLE60262.1 PRTRC system protein F [Burkholderia plantarii]
MNTTPMMLPRLDNVPAAVFAGGDGDFSHALALALLRGKIITAGDAADIDAGTTDYELASCVVTRLWQTVVAGHRYFDWNLSIEEAVTYPNETRPRRARFRIHTQNGVGGASQLALRTGVMRLEAFAAGLGETVLAVLYEACHHYLPTIVTPSMSLDIAQYVYWNGHRDEIAALPEMRDWYDHHDGSIENDDAEAFFLAHNISRRSEFFQSCPDWIFEPQQRLTEANIRHIERFDVFAACVIQACDEIHRIITQSGPFPRVDCYDACGAPLDYALILRWAGDDSTDRILDDHFEHEMQGDAVEGSCERALNLDGGQIAKWLRGMQKTGDIARAVEQLLNLIATRAEDDINDARIQVRV